MKCHLCRKDTELRNSHIIPEFVYKALYDKKHKFHVLSTLEDRPQPMKQKGIREKLLCDACEQQLSVYEKYAREILLGGREITVQHQGELLLVTELDYKKFKLFQLSILWRASISNHPMFSNVKLGPHEKEVREMIHAENPGSPTDYPCIIFGLTSKSGVHGDFIDQPRLIRIDGYVTYRFVFSGFMWSFYVSSHRLPSLLKDVALNETGQMTIGRGSFEDLTEFNNFAVKLYKMGRMHEPTK